MLPRISIITAVYNRESTISSAIDSVLSQQNANIEYIVIDGKSFDRTQEIVQSYGNRIDKSICEADAGIYDALNKGIHAATGEVVGFLHADDLFAGPDVVSKISKFFLDPSIDAVYGDLVYVDAGRLDRIVRYWKSGKFQSNRFRRGWMPPHPTVYLRRQRYLDFGVYRKDFQISADYELLIRMMFKQCVKTAYLDEVIVKMRLGGKSNASMHNRLLANWEDRRAWEVNDLRPPFALQLLKPLRKLRQFWTRPKRVLA